MIRHLIPSAPDLDITLAHYEHSNDPVYKLAPELLLPSNPIRAAARLNSGNFDVVHFSPLTIISPIHGLRAGKTATIHSAEPMLLPDQYSLIKRLHSRFLIPCYARKLDVLVTVSETSKRYFAENYGVPPERIVVTYNACASAYRQLPKGTPPSPKSGWSFPGRYILHVSRFSERKNPWTMLEAFARLATGPEPLHLVLAGKGWDGPASRERAAALNIAERVATPGFVAEETVVELLNRAELFWFPSLSEGFGMPNVEAMACGCPVITSRSFAIPEIVGDGALLLDDPLDAEDLVRKTREILDDPERRSSLVEAGLRQAGRYSWEKSAVVLADVFRSVAQKRR